MYQQTPLHKTILSKTEYGPGYYEIKINQKLKKYKLNLNVYKPTSTVQSVRSYQ